MSAEIADVLDKAAEVIETRGWGQGAYWSGSLIIERCSVCVLGAVSVATIRHPNFDAALAAEPYTVKAAADALAKAAGVKSYPSVPDWNDDPDRTQAEVIAALRNAATAERAS